MRRASNIAAMLAIALVVLGLGGVHTAVAGTAAVVALVAAALEVGYLKSRNHDILLSWVGAALLLAVGMCLVQLVPIPAFVHSLLNPHGLELYETGCKLAGIDAQGWRPLSLDPAVTADRALRYIALAGMSLWAANLRGKRAWGTFAQWFVPLALIDLLVGFGLFVTKPATFFGLYEPAVGFRGPTTFLSTNHGAFFLGLVALMSGAAALGVRRDHPRRAMAFGVAVPVFAVAALSMNSDGVMIALAATVITAVVVQWLRLGRPRNLRLDVKLGVGSLVVLSAIAAVWLDLHRLVGGFLERVAFGGEHGARLALIEAGLSALPDYWRFGAGAGAIETMLPGYLDWSALVPASIPVIENDTLEVLLSFGVVLGGLMLLLVVGQVAAQLSVGTDGHRSPRYAVALVCTVYVGLLSQLHFPLFALGIGIPTVVWFDLLCSRRRISTGGEHVFKTGHVAVDWRVAVALLFLLGGGALAAAQAHYDWYAAPASLDSEDALAREVWRRPASHVPYVKFATLAAKAGSTDRALALADFAAAREPSPRVRLYRAQIVALVDEQRGAEAFAELFAEGHTYQRSIDSFLRGVPTTALRVGVLQDLPQTWEPVTLRIQVLDGADATSSFVVGLASARPGDVEVYRLAARAYLRLKQPILSRLWAELVADAERVQGSDAIEAPLLLARALRATGNADDARAALDAAARDPALVREAHREALTLRGLPDPKLIDFVSRHHQIYCASPVPVKDQKLCWASEAWLMESKREFATARRVLKRIQRRLDDPIPLADFYLRTNNCAELRTLARTLEPGPQRRQVETIGTRCVPK